MCTHSPGGIISTFEVGGDVNGVDVAGTLLATGGPGENSCSAAPLVKVAVQLPLLYLPYRQIVSSLETSGGFARAVAQLQRDGAGRFGVGRWQHSRDWRRHRGCSRLEYV